MRVRILMLLLFLIAPLYSSGVKVFYYELAGDLRSGFRKAGVRSLVKPDNPNYAISYIDTSGRERRVAFYKKGKLVEFRKINTDGNVTYMEGKSFLTPSSWYEAIYTYREKEKFKTFVKEIDYRIYKDKVRRHHQILHREITRFLLVKEGNKYWNVLFRRDFLPGNRLHHYWIYKFAKLEDEKPSLILEYDVNGKLLRQGVYRKVGARQVLMFKRVS